jgi:hypothetical protein
MSHVFFVTLALVGLLAHPGEAQVADHLKCYKVKDPQAKATYTADLGGLVAEPGCTIKVPAFMACVPATKANVTPIPPGTGGSGTPDTFGCYKIKCPKASLPALHLNDQFGSRSVTPTAPKLLCAPAVPFCRGPADCPIGTACNTTTGQCENACGDANHSICYGGCCGGGTCQPGTVESACGDASRNGGACEVCDGANQAGSVCVNHHCGCTSAGDCPAGRSCLLAGIFVCTSSCNKPNLTACNVGCCSAALDGTCEPGMADTACGNTGETCVDCTSSGDTCVNGVCQP